MLSQVPKVRACVRVTHRCACMVDQSFGCKPTASGSVNSRAGLEVFPGKMMSAQSWTIKHLQQLLLSNLDFVSDDDCLRNHPFRESFSLID